MYRKLARRKVCCLLFLSKNVPRFKQQIELSFINIRVMAVHRVHVPLQNISGVMQDSRNMDRNAVNPMSLLD